MSHRVPNPDPTRLDPEPVRVGFLEALVDDRVDPPDDRLSRRARLLLDAHPLAGDAQTYAVALIDWAAHDVLGTIEPAALALPRASDWSDIPPLAEALAPIVKDLEAAWTHAYRSRSPHLQYTDDERTRELSTRVQIGEEIKGALKTMRRIPKYRLTDPGWKGKQQRPTPISLCVDAAERVAEAVRSAVDVAADAEWALETLGLQPGDSSGRAVRARRALRDAGFSAPDGLLIDYVAALCATVDASPRSAPAVLAERAFEICVHDPAAIAGQDATLRVRPLRAPATTIAAASRQSVIEVGEELVPWLIASQPERQPQTPAHGASTPLEQAYRPGPDEHADRLLRRLERGRIDPLGSLVALRALRNVSEPMRTRVLDVAIDTALSDRIHDDSYVGQVTRTRRTVGALPGVQLLAWEQSGRGRGHWWLSAPDSDPDARDFARTICGDPMDAGRWKPASTLTPDCPDCVERVAGLAISGPPDPPAEPARLRVLLRSAAETVAAEREAQGEIEEDGNPWDDSDRVRPWTLRNRLDAAVLAAVRIEVAAEAAALGEICAQRVLGPSRYRRERAKFPHGQIAAHLRSEDWEQVLETPEGSRSRKLLDLAAEIARPKLSIAGVPDGEPSEEADPTDPAG